MTSEDFSTSLRSTLRASTAASTVSIAVPVKRSLAGGGAVLVGDLEGDVEAAVARVVAHDGGCMAPVIAGVQPDIAGIAVEGQAEIGGVAEPVAALQRAGDLLLRCPCPRCVRASRVTEISFRSRVSTPIT